MAYRRCALQRVISRMSDLILRKMHMIAFDEEGGPITKPGEHPPCFESLQQWRAWLEAVDPEMGSPPPPRKDWPGEPNYCRDCTIEHKRQMCAEHRCLFPDIKFIEVGENAEDKEVVGVSP